MSETDNNTTTESTEIEEEATPILECHKCNKTGTDFARCSRCKEVFYCSRTCQASDWAKHKVECIRPEDRPRPPTEEEVVGFVECASYEECRDWLAKHPAIINKATSDEMFQKGYLALKTHPVEIGSRFIRNAQILQYLLDIRKASGGQQDITLFFSRILDSSNPEYKNSFNKEWQDLVKRIIARLKEKEKEEAQKKETTDQTEQTA
eukprot:TRINITY_DN2225_c0_g1_i1.p1 TRINITY_DN2225_c0_g1~~TRINITY_DN2225_c0_g1_i1.p1  ORF type:complete len:207 (+),score=43.29 TRINITY_DN2225_c0_g1_i1:58-678(+)